MSDKLYEEGLSRGAWDRNGTLSIGATQKYFSPELTDVEKTITDRIQSYPGAAEGREARIRILGQRGYERLAQGNEIIQEPSWFAKTRLQWNQIKTQFKDGEALWDTIFRNK